MLSRKRLICCTLQSGYVLDFEDSASLLIVFEISASTVVSLWSFFPLSNWCFYCSPSVSFLRHNSLRIVYLSTFTAMTDAYSSDTGTVLLYELTLWLVIGWSFLDTSILFRRSISLTVLSMVRKTFSKNRVCQKTEIWQSETWNGLNFMCSSVPYKLHLFDLKSIVLLSTENRND